LLGLGLAALLVGFGLYYRSSLNRFGSIAVLPFTEVTNDVSLAYLRQGMTISLTNDLSRVSGLTVTAESVVSRLDASVDPVNAGRKLHVEAVVSGSIRKKENLLIVSIEVVDSATGAQLWGQSYTRETSDLASLQEELAREIAYQLRMRVDENLSTRLRRQYSTNSKTYNQYLLGSYDLNKRTRNGFESALSHFQLAIDSDPKYAPAFAGIANCYILMAYNRVQPTVVLLSKGRGAAVRALQLDSTLAEAYSAIAMSDALGDFRWARAEEMYKRAIALNPNYIPAHTWYGLTLLVPLGRTSEARAQFEYAKRLDPESLVTLTSVALADYYSGNYDASIAEAQSLQRKSPDFEAAVEILATDYLAKNMALSAVSALSTRGELSHDASAIRNALLGVAFARMGQRQRALEKLQETKLATERGESLNYWLACLYASIGEHESALSSLEAAYRSRQASVLFLKSDPLLYPLRGDQGFQRMLIQLDLP
jgi:TolB-like protein